MEWFHSKFIGLKKRGFKNHGWDFLISLGPDTATPLPLTRAVLGGASYFRDASSKVLPEWFRLKAGLITELTV